jgi:hypothetical protein
MKAMVAEEPTIKLAMLKKYTNEETIFHKLAWWRFSSLLSPNRYNFFNKVQKRAALRHKLHEHFFDAVQEVQRQKI